MSTLSILLHLLAFLALVGLCGWVRYRAFQHGLAAGYVTPHRWAFDVPRQRHA